MCACSPRALSAYYKSRKTELLEGYSKTCLERVWKAQRFSWWMTQIFHVFPERSAVRPAPAIGGAGLHRPFPRCGDVAGRELYRACRSSKSFRTLENVRLPDIKRTRKIGYPGRGRTRYGGNRRVTGAINKCRQRKPDTGG